MLGQSNGRTPDVGKEMGGAGGAVVVGEVEEVSGGVELVDCEVALVEAGLDVLG